MKLFRPIGVKEYVLIKELNYQAFPPRLDWQPIFYPVLNRQYAEQIALQWNTKDEFSGFCGLVTEFSVADSIVQKYEVKEVGAEVHQELWVPAEELDEFNRAIDGPIEVINAFFGPQFKIENHPFLKVYFEKFGKT